LFFILSVGNIALMYVEFKTDANNVNNCVPNSDTNTLTDLIYSYKFPPHMKTSNEIDFPLTCKTSTTITSIILTCRSFVNIPVRLPQLM